MTDFQLGDLLRLQPRAGSHDLIMCRNTVIYFAEPIRDELHARLADALRPGGYLVVGATERVAKPADLGLELVHPFIYRRAS
jgi:chemotaxis protein methyltransferase CheR